MDNKLLLNRTIHWSIDNVLASVLAVLLIASCRNTGERDVVHDDTVRMALSKADTLGLHLKMSDDEVLSAIGEDPSSLRLVDRGRDQRSDGYTTTYVSRDVGVLITRSHGTQMVVIRNRLSADREIWIVQAD